MTAQLDPDHLAKAGPDIDMQRAQAASVDRGNNIDDLFPSIRQPEGGEAWREIVER